MNLKEAIRVLDICTSPNAAGKLSRADYAACEEAIQCLVKMDQEADKKDSAKDALPKEG